MSFAHGRAAQFELHRKQDPSCGEIPPPSDTGEYAGVYSAGFNVKFDDDARFSGDRPSTSRPGVTARAGGRLVGNEIVGWYRYVNTESGCDSGPMAYGTGPVQTLDSPAPSTGFGVTYVARGGEAGASFGLKTAADLFCGALPVAPNGARLLEGYVVTPGPDGSFQTSGPLAEGSPATVTISGKLVGETDITGTFRYQDAQTGCDSGPVPFGTIATSEPAEPGEPGEPADEEGA